MACNFRVRRAGVSFSPGHSWWLWLLASALILVADQAVKHAIVALTPYGASYPVTSFFNLVHVWNRGAAFSLLAEAGGWQRYAFIALGIGVSAALAWLLRRGCADRMEALAYTLIIGGALGNVADRMALGFVVDYLDFHWRGWHWPAFNLADIAIMTGAALLIAASGLAAGPAKGGAMTHRGD